MTGRGWVGISVAFVCVVALIVIGSISKWPRDGVIERAYFISQTVGLGVAIVAAVVVVVQIADIRRTLRRGDFDSTSARILRISELQLSHKREYRMLLRGRLTPASRNLAEALLDLMDTEMLRRRTMDEFVDPSIPSLDAYFADLLSENAGLAATLRQRSGWYSAELLALAAANSGGRSGKP